MRRIRTYLEMTAPDQLVASRTVPGLELADAGPGSQLLRATTIRVGDAYHWPAGGLSDEVWERELHAPGRFRGLLRLDGEVVGVAELEVQPGEVEILNFGLLPEYHGKGLGGPALTLTVERAWGLEVPGGGRPGRVWLHTSTRDHPNALANYTKRGFRPYRTEVRGEGTELGG
jgi:GNAT superfamily N-acetyltransferase